MSKEFIFFEEIKEHPNRDYTWELDNFLIEEKIKKLRKELYHLQNCRKKQPKLVVFRNEKHGLGPMRAHIFHGFSIMNMDKGYIVADYWSPITSLEAEALFAESGTLIKQKYKDIIEETLEANK